MKITGNLPIEIIGDRDYYRPTDRPTCILEAIWSLDYTKIEEIVEAIHDPYFAPDMDLEDMVDCILSAILERDEFDMYFAHHRIHINDHYFINVFMSL